MQSYDNSQLLQKIDRNYKTRTEFCRAAGIEPQTFYKEQSAGNWSADTIIKAATALKIPAQEIGFYFFRPASDPTTEELYKIYAQLTPENKQKVIAKYYELLEEQGRTA